MAKYQQQYQQHIDQLTAPGEHFEIIKQTIDGREYRVYKNAPPNLREMLAVARTHGDKPFLVYQQQTLTFKEFFAEVDALAATLVKDYAIQIGDKVAIAMRNYPEWVVAFAAIMHIGAVAVPINSWGKGHEIIYGVKDSDSKLIFVDQQRYSSISDEADKDLDIVIAKAERNLNLRPRARHWEDLIADGIGHKAPQRTIDSEDLAIIMYTSGTTGAPKGVIGRQRHIVQSITNFECTGFAMGMVNAEVMGEILQGGAEFSHLLAVPFFHVSGLYAAFILNLRAGRKMLIMHKWDPQQALELIAKHRVGLLGVSPSMLMQLLSLPEFDEADTSMLFGLGAGGSAYSPKLFELAEKKKPKGLPGIGYGMTESHACGCSTSGLLMRERSNASGLTSPIMEFKFCDPESKKTVVDGARGEAWLYGPTVADGYWNKPQETAKSFQDGWFISGDIGFADEDGYIHICDRIKDIVIRGGENIDTQEVEAAIQMITGVNEAAVFGVPDEIMGEQLVAIAHLEKRSKLDQAKIQSALKEKLAHFKIPSAIRISSKPLERSPVGKIVKHKMRDAWLQEA